MCVLEHERWREREMEKKKARAELRVHLVDGHFPPLSRCGIVLLGENKVMQPLWFSYFSSITKECLYT